MSSPFPKAFPRGGGIYEQDPELMRDFRMIRKFELEWKETERAKDEAKQNLGKVGQLPSSPTKGGGFNLEQLLDELAENS